MRRGLFLLLALLLLVPPAGAAVKKKKPIIHDDGAQPPEELPKTLEVPPRSEPLLIRMMIHPIKRGMFIALPIVDTDPNRGVTYGIMPIWVVQEKGGTRITQIHAPSVTYNKTFRWIPTYRYYWYPTDKSNWQFRTSISRLEDRELMVMMEDLDFLHRGIAVNAKFQYDVDGSKRFFGIGPDSKTDAEANFTRKIAQYYYRLGVPILKDSGLRVNFAHHLAGVRVAAGTVDNLTDIGIKYPEHTPDTWHQDAEFQLFLDYDTRDEAVTTTRGSYVKIMIENSQRGFGSEFAFQRYAIDLRHFHKHKKLPLVTAAGFKYQQLVGNAAFYLLPTLGGKYVFRAYGEGRYIDKGMMAGTIEERFTVYKVEVAGVTTEVEIAPFAGVGNVFPAPRRSALAFVRPMFGSAFRAIARPQVVGAVDVGIGQDGAAVFMDINYAF